MLYKRGVSTTPSSPHNVAAMQMAIAPVKTVLLNFIFGNVVHFVPHRLTLMCVSGCKSKDFERLVIKGIWKEGLKVQWAAPFKVQWFEVQLGGYIPKWIFRGSAIVIWLTIILLKTGQIVACRFQNLPRRHGVHRG